MPAHRTLFHNFSEAGFDNLTPGVSSDAAGDLSALVAVAEQARQSVMESLQYQSTGIQWPACPAHGLGTSPRAHRGTGIWWCDDGVGHVAAEIGHWAAREPRLGRGHIANRRPGRREHKAMNTRQRAGSAGSLGGRNPPALLRPAGCYIRVPGGHGDAFAAPEFAAAIKAFLTSRTDQPGEH
jgi:hypothetical protein